MMSIRYKKVFSLIAIIFAIPFFTFAATGTIDTVNKYSRVMNDSLLGGTSLINWQPTGVGTTTITDTGITGYIWSESFGFINLAPTGAGVTNTTSGVLGGYAWGQNTGWIDFAPTGGGVTISPTTGEFSGYAWGQNTGWIEFDCGGGACVQTDWRGTSGGGGGGGGSPDSVCEDGDDNDGDGLTDYPNDPGCTSSNDSDESNLVAEPACADGLDNDNDGQIDFPQDVGCVSAADTSELYTPVTTICADGLDNDGDGLIDYPSDPGCSSSTDGNEYDVPIEEPCVGAGCVPGDGDDPLPGGDDGTPIDEPGPTDGIDPTPDTPSGGDGFVGGVIDFFTTTTGSGVPMTLPPLIGILAALLPLLFAASPGGVVFLPFQMWSLFFGRKKTEHPWGTVYDAITKRPLDPAYVVLSKAPTEPGVAGDMVGESITDIDGRYGFLVPGGRYVITAGKTHYAFPSQKMAGRTRDELYDNLYFGEPIDVAHDGDVILRNIPMDPLEFDWNEFRKTQMGLSGGYRVVDKILSRLSSILFVAGCAFAIFAYMSSPTIWNTVVLGIYAVMILVRLAMGPLRPFGVLTEQSSKLPLAYAIVRIFSVSGVEVAHKVADEAGRYYCLLAKGTYTVTIEKKLDDGSYQKIFTSRPLTIKKRYLNKKFAV